MQDNSPNQQPEHIWEKRRAISGTVAIVTLLLLTPIIFATLGGGLKLLYFFLGVWALAIIATWVGTRFRSPNDDAA